MDQVRIQFLGSGDAFGSGGRFQTCFHLSGPSEPILIDCGASSLIALKRAGLDPSEIGCVLLTHLHGDHFGGLPFLSRSVRPVLLAISGFWAIFGPMSPWPASPWHFAQTPETISAPSAGDFGPCEATKLR